MCPSRNAGGRRGGVAHIPEGAGTPEEDVSTSLGSPVSWKGICVSKHLLYPRQGEAFCNPAPA